MIQRSDDEMPLVRAAEPTHNEEESAESRLADKVRDFHRVTRSIVEANVNVRVFLDRALDGARKRTDEYIEDHAERVQAKGAADESSVYFQFLHPKPHAEFRGLLSTQHSIIDAIELVPSAFLLSMMAKFESLLLAVLEYAADYRPDVFLDPEVKFAITELEPFDTVETFRSHLLRRGIDEVSRGSAYEVLKFLRNKLNVDFDLEPAWKRFIEVSGRRNCHAHNDGRVSQQYLASTKSVGYAFLDPIEVGDYLPISQEYFVSASEVVLEIGLKIAFSVWVALATGKARSSLAEVINDIALDAIKSRRFSTAREILRFGERELEAELDNADRLTFGLNIAQTYKWEGNQDAMEEVLSKMDFTAASDRFRLGLAVLQDRFDDAKALIPRCCGHDNEDINADALFDWPIFQDFRKTDAFVEGFTVAFGYSPLTERLEADGSEDVEDLSQH